MKTNKKIFLHLFLLTIATFTLELTLGSERVLSVKEVVDLYRTSLDQIKTIEADCVVSSPDKDTASGFDLDSDANAIVYDYHWYYDQDTGKEYQKGKGAIPDNGKLLHYREECRGYNGDDLYSYCITSNSGLRQKGKWDEYGNSYFTFSTPLFLLGKDCCASDERTLIDLLSENVDSINLIRQDEHEITLSCDYHYGSSDKPKTRNVTVTLDPQHGFLPKYAEFKRIPFNVLTTRMKITKFTETSNGIWFPIEALDEEFYMDEPIQEDGVHYQNGMTADELLAMTEEDRWKVIPSLGYRSVHLSTLTYRVNPKTLKINEPFDESLLTLDRFPDGMYVWDDILQLGYKVGRFDDPNYVGAAKTETWWTVVRIFLIAVGTVIVCLGIGLHLKKRFAARTD